MNQSYASQTQNASGIQQQNSPAAGSSSPTKTQIVIEDLDKAIHKWLRPRIDPHQWTTAKPQDAPSPEQITNARAGKTFKNGGANKFGAYTIAATRQGGGCLWVCSGAGKGFIEIGWTYPIGSKRDQQFIAQELANYGIGNRLLVRPKTIMFPADFEGRSPAAIVAIYRRLEDGLRRLLVHSWALPQVFQCHTERLPSVAGQPVHHDAGGAMQPGGMIGLLPWDEHTRVVLPAIPDVPILLVEAIAKSLTTKYPPTPLTPTPGPAPIDTALPTQTQNQSARPIPPESLVPTEDINPENDELTRLRKALMRLARFWGQVPTETEAQEFLERRGIIDTGKQKAKSQIRSTLKFIAKSFDAQKCQTGEWIEATRRRLDRWRDYAAGEFSSPAKIERAAVFLAVCEYVLFISPNEDGTVPRDGFQALWDEIVREGLSDARPWQLNTYLATRNHYEDHGVIIVGTHWHTGKAKIWTPGPNWPSQPKDTTTGNCVGPRRVIAPARPAGADNTPENHPGYKTPR